MFYLSFKLQLPENISILLMNMAVAHGKTIHPMPDTQREGTRVPISVSTTFILKPDEL